MAIQIALIKDYCDKLGYKYEFKDDMIAMGWQHARPDQKNASFVTYISTPNEGLMFDLQCVGILPKELVAKSPNREAFFFALLNYAWLAPFGTPEVNNDGEVRYLVEVPIEDGTLTLKQFERIVQGAVDGAATVEMIAETTLLGKTPEVSPPGSTEEQSKVILNALMALQDPSAPAELKQLARELLTEIQNNPSLTDYARQEIAKALSISQGSSPRMF